MSWVLPSKKGGLFGPPFLWSGRLDSNQRLLDPQLGTVFNDFSNLRTADWNPPPNSLNDSSRLTWVPGCAGEAQPGSEAGLYRHPLALAKRASVLAFRLICFPFTSDMSMMA